MNKELFDSMQEQMKPSPEVRTALSEKLAQPAKKRPTPWKQYVAVAACAALVVGVFPVHRAIQARQEQENINAQELLRVPLHSYVMVEGLTGYAQENAAVTIDTGAGGAEPATNTGDLSNREDAPGGAYIGDVPVQEEAVNAYQNLMDRFNGTYPDWYGGAYIDNTATLIVCLVEDKDPGDKTLELQVMDWTDNGRVAFTDVKYSLAYLKGLMDQLNALPEADPQCREFMAGWGVDEEANRIELTLTQANAHVLAVLAELDRSDDAIYVQVGQRAVADVGTEEPAVHHVMPGGVTVPDDEDLIAVEPYYDGAHYDVENLPAELPEKKQPALMDSVPEEDAPTRTEDASTANFNPDKP